MSKYHPEKSNIYIDGTDTPKNNLNIEDSEIIHEIEKELLVQAYTIFSNEIVSSTVFDESYFKSIHYRTFETLYSWAGEYRNYDLWKGDSMFCRGQFVESETKRIFLELKGDDYLKNYADPKNIEMFAGKLAYYKCELIALHPFCELNGRTTRLYFDMIALYNGYSYIDYSGCSPEEYIDASIECVQQAKCDHMKRIIKNGLVKN